MDERQDEAHIPPDAVDRAMRIILDPRAEWRAIEIENATIAGLYRGYVLRLAAIPPVAQFIGGMIFGYYYARMTYRPSLSLAVSSALASYVLSLAGIYALALIIERLAPLFGGSADRVQAFKVAAYAATPVWAAGVFAIVPILAPLTLLGFYALYLAWLGLPQLMMVPRQKAPLYVAAVVAIAVALGLAANLLAGVIGLRFGSGLVAL